MSQIWIMAVALIGVQLVRSLPAIIWSWRCPPNSRNYRCPHAGGHSAVSAIFRRLR